MGPTRAFVPKPSTLTHVQAAALPLVSLTGWQSLVETAGIRSGDRVLIHAASGGVGHVAVQIAKAHGAYVIGTASAKNNPFLTELGVDEAIDYRSVDFAEVVRDVDIVLDTIGGDYQWRSLQTLRPGGIMVSTIPRPTEGLWKHAQRLGVRAELILVEADHGGMQHIAALAAEGTLQPRIAETYPLRDAVTAHRAGETGRTVGKMVFVVD